MLFRLSQVMSFALHGHRREKRPEMCMITCCSCGSGTDAVCCLRSNKECPTCRKKLVSKRSLRPDPNFDALISKWCQESCALHVDGFFLCHFHVTVEEETWQHLNNESSNKDRSINKWIDSSIHLCFLWRDASTCSVTQRCCSRGLNRAEHLFKSATDVGERDFLLLCFLCLPESDARTAEKTDD